MLAWEHACTHGRPRLRTPTHPPTHSPTHLPSHRRRCRRAGVQVHAHPHKLERSLSCTQPRKMSAGVKSNEACARLTPICTQDMTGPADITSWHPRGCCSPCSTEGVRA
eukprot:2285438-Alexandrium_andersonii.AAC.1